MRLSTRLGAASTVALALGASMTAAASGPAARAVDWNELQPPAAESRDPFAGMPDDQLDALREIVKSRVLEARGFPVTDAMRRHRAGLTQGLAALGVDVEVLLAARDALIGERRRAAEAGVASLDGKDVRLAGYLLPSAVKDGVVTELLLVPTPGACSHASPPMPNQTVRVRPARPFTPSDAYEPAWISGTLRVRLERSSVYVVDGELAVSTTYAIDDAAIAAANANPR